MKVREIMNSCVTSVSPSTPILDVAKRMREARMEAMPVCEGDKLVGVINHRDMVGVVAQGWNPRKAQAGSLMNREVITISPEAELIKASILMAERGLRWLLVEDKGRLVGILSLEELATESETFAGVILARLVRSRGSEPRAARVRVSR